MITGTLVVNDGVITVVGPKSFILMLMSCCCTIVVGTEADDLLN